MHTLGIYATLPCPALLTYWVPARLASEKVMYVPLVGCVR